MLVVVVVVRKQKRVEVAQPFSPLSLDAGAPL
jgi:hypothetical protein